MVRSCFSPDQFETNLAHSLAAADIAIGAVNSRNCEAFCSWSQSATNPDTAGFSDRPNPRPISTTQLSFA
jgi:hypothetical protein